jgi:Glycosyl hydrolase family 71
MIFKIDALKTCAGLVCVSFFAALGGCGSDSSASTTSSNAPASSTAAGSTAPSSTAPSSTAPSSTAPSSTAPSSTAPRSTAPASTSGGKTASPPTAIAVAAPAKVATPASTLVTSSNNGDACLPSTMPSADTLFSSTKKVFAHYFSPFPLSIGNLAPAVDYYNTQYLAIDGESGKWVAEGGYLRQRPLGTTPSLLSNWQQRNMEAEIRTAIARGITGFTFDSMSAAGATDSTGPLQMLLAAAHAVDSRFKIVVMPDLTALGSDSAAVVQIIASVANSPAAYRLSDGRLVVTAFDAGLNSAAWWQSVLNTLNAKDIKVAFVPTFLGWNQHAAAFAPISYGFADWGTATAPGSSAFESAPGTAHSTYGKIFMMPVDPQQYRPYDFVFEEAGNSAAFRAAWTSSIKGDSDWVQLVTWSDFSESSEVQPYTDATLNTSIGTGYYDLNGYYAAWFLTGQQPAITHDVLYYFYRREPTTAAAPAQKKIGTTNTTPASNNIELLAFLTAPGEISITIGGKTYTQSAGTGVTSFTIPSQPGVPQFALSRDGDVVFSFNGGVQIYGAGGLPSKVQDLTYWSGSAAASGNCAL